MSPYPFSPKKSYRTTGLIASKRSDRNANGRRARKSTERKEDATVLKRSSESNNLFLVDGSVQNLNPSFVMFAPPP
ncbi:hypothetical protein TNCV_779231 [Trichonephila clavipes]|nr:hypothetical protein TNCV_779231 [Trichonephila clavipes]